MTLKNKSQTTQQFSNMRGKSVILPFYRILV